MESGMAAQAVEIRRISKMERIAALDVLRGVAILAILLMNIPYMGGYMSFALWDPRLISWTAADQAVYRLVETLFSGTQRGMLEMLFGAGIMIMSRQAMQPDGPVAVADLHYRRNLWLAALGVFQASLLFWPGDILFPYGLTAIFVFPFRTLKPRWQIAVALAAFVLSTGYAALDYREGLAKQAQFAAAEAQVARKAPVSAEQRKLVEEHQAAAARMANPAHPEKLKAMAEEKAARLGSFSQYFGFTFGIWGKFTFGETGWWTFVEIFETMLVGSALYQWGFLQGRWRPGAYLLTALAAYAVGLPLRIHGVNEYLAFTPGPRIGQVTSDFARLCMTLGHISLILLALRSRLGRTLLSPFQATGRMPLTTYLGASIICLVVLFPGIGFGLFGRYGWAGLEVIALIVMAAQLAFANLWLAFFETGPFEWVWKSLAYLKPQPFRKGAAEGALAAAE
jgi:uncharacterized protein